jgi:23S rRNA pseudouridine1911/1915/1917 synthase
MLNGLHPAIAAWSNGASANPSSWIRAFFSLDTMPHAGLEILYEDNHLLAITKPAGLATMGVASDAPSVVTLAKQYIKQKYHKPGEVYLGVVSRLDAPTTGIVLLARTSKAASRLAQQFRQRSAAKTYWAIVSGKLAPPQGELIDWVTKDEARQRMIVSGPWDAGAKEARLRYRQLRAVDAGSLLEIDLLSGRKHQIRLQLAARGHPIWGETKYGRGAPFADGLALHSRQLVIEHPTRRQPLTLLAPLPRSWQALGIDG